MNSRKEILIVEDDDDAVVLMKYALKEGRIMNPVHFETDGKEAIAYLLSETATKVGFVFLDLHLPGKSGQEVLSWIRDQAPLSHLVVIVTTASNHDADARACTLLGANAVVAKPADLKQFIELVRAFKEFWVKFHQFPRVLFR